MEFVKPPEAFSFEEPNAPQRWARWEKQFNTYYTAAELAGKSEEVQVARLLNAAGPEAQEIHELFTFDAEEDKKDYKKVLKKFSEYCRPKKNVVFERYRFWSRSQKEDEPFDKWLKDLRLIAKDCEFTEEENMIRDNVVFSVFDKRVQERMLRKCDLKLKDAMETCRAAESSQNQMSEMRRGESTSFNAVSSSDHKQKKCFSCGKFGHIAPNCPKDEDQEDVLKCFQCSGFGHYSTECPTPNDEGGNPIKKKKRKSRRGRGRGRGGANRSVNVVEEKEVDQYVQEFSALSLSSLQMNSLLDKTRKRFAKFRFHNPQKRKSKTEECKVDSGSEANAITMKKYKELYPERFDENGVPDPKYLRKSNRKLEAYRGQEVPHHGTVNLPVEYAGKKFMCRFFLCDIEGSILLGLPTCEALGIIKITIINELSEQEGSNGPEGQSVEKRAKTSNQLMWTSEYINK